MRQITQAVKHQLDLLLLGVLGLGMVMVLAFIAVQQLAHFQKQAADQLKAIAMATSRATQTEPVLQDARLAEQVLAESLGAHPEIVAAAIYDRSGRLFARYGAEQLLSAELADWEASDPVVLLFDPVADQTRLIQVDGRPLGLLYLRADLRHAWRHLYAQFAWTSAGVLFIFSLSLLIGLRLLRRILRPVSGE